MISVFFRMMAPRLVLVALIGWLFYLLEPAFHQHEVAERGLEAAFGVYGLSATLANFAGLSVLVLLAGFIAGDRRRGWYRIFFAHPTRPLAFYGVRWVMAVVMAVAAAAVFLVVGQLAAWGSFDGGWIGLHLALLSAIAYGGLVAFLSALLPRGDSWVSIVIFFIAFFWLQWLQLGAEPLPPLPRDIVTLLLPPQTALQDVYDGILRGEINWAASAFAAGYGAFWLVLAAAMVRWREWP
ncbi:MAG TPA: hypothetical protein VFQ39_11715 [Longimicrobium sp.]|nr:hypothetical protein [Longimicrobium sp.]